MKPTVRSILAVLLGSLVTFVLIMGIEGISSVIYPLPEGVDPNDMEALKVAIPKMPLGGKVLVLISYAVGTFVGAWLAAWFARRAHMVHAMIVAGLFLAGDIVNLNQLPHPMWMAVVSLAIFPVCALLGAGLAALKQAPPA